MHPVERVSLVEILVEVDLKGDPKVDPSPHPTRGRWSPEGGPFWVSQGLFQYSPPKVHLSLMMYYIY